MNWDQLEGGWKQRRGRAVHQWGKIMNDELTKMAGKYEELVGKLQEKYGNARETTVRQQNDFAKVVAQLRQANARLMTLLAKLRDVKPVLRKRAIAKKRASTRRSNVRRT